MSTVHTTQQTIQLLLATSEYVGALDLIATTQEVLANELVGVHCFRYLGTQLSEIEKVIDKMLVEDFVAYAQSDLNRPIEVGEAENRLLRKKDEEPKNRLDVGGDFAECEYPGIGLRFDATGKILKAPSPSPDSTAEEADAAVAYLDVATADVNDEDDPLVAEEERLVALVLGMLRLNKFNFLDIYKTEIASATKTLVRRAVTERVEMEPIEIESLPEQDANVACLADEMRLMTFRQWLPLMDLIFRRIVVFLRRIKAVNGVMCDVLKMAAGKSEGVAEGVVEGELRWEKGMKKTASDGALKSSSSSGRSTPQRTIPKLTTGDGGDEHPMSQQKSRLLLPMETTVTLNLSEEEFTKLMNRIRELLWFACDHAQDRCIKVKGIRAPLSDSFKEIYILVNRLNDSMFDPFHRWIHALILGYCVSCQRWLHGQDFLSGICAPLQNGGVFRRRVRTSLRSARHGAPIQSHISSGAVRQSFPRRAQNQA